MRDSLDWGSTCTPTPMRCSHNAGNAMRPRTVNASATLVQGQRMTLRAQRAHAPGVDRLGRGK